MHSPVILSSGMGFPSVVRRQDVETAILGIFDADSCLILLNCCKPSLILHRLLSPPVPHDLRRSTCISPSVRMGCAVISSYFHGGSDTSRTDDVLFPIPWRVTGECGFCIHEGK